MPLMKQAIPINFAKGLDQKSDPKQLQIGSFLELENSVFTKAGLLQKRNGNAQLTSLPNTNSDYLTTFNNNLTAIGNNILAYSQSNDVWVTKGTIAPVSVSTLPLIRNSVNQTACDSVVASNGLVLTAYTQTNDTLSAVNTQYLFVIADSTTGQNIIEPTLIPPLASGLISGSSRVFIVENFFVIISTVTVAGNSFLQYVSIPMFNPNNISAPQNVYPEAYAPSHALAWDGVSYGGNLVVAYNTTVGGQSIHVTFLTAAQIALNSDSSVVKTYAGQSATVVSVSVDTTNPTLPIYYVAYYSSNTTNGFVLAVSTSVGIINTALAPTQVITGMSAVNIASAAQNAVCTIFYEVLNFYTYDTTIPTHYVSTVTCTQAGVVGPTSVSIRSVGLASKAFIVDKTIYYLSAFQSTYQDSYFLINGTLSVETSPVVVGKLAYENGGGYLTLGLPSVSVIGSSAQIAYLYKDLIEALTTIANPQQTTAGGIYSQAGINLSTLTLGTQNIDTAEIGANLNISGGFGWMYDGYLPVEQDFFVWPDNIEATYTEVSTVTPTGTAASGSFTIVVSSATGISPGMSIADTTNPTFIPTGTLVTLVNGTTLTMSAATTSAIAGDTLSIQGNIAAQPDSITNTDAYYYQALYEWMDNQGNIFRSAPSIPIAVTTVGTGTSGTITINVPTLRLTYKVPNPLKIVIYRWSVENQVYHQVTSVIAPLLNNTSVDSVSFVDTLSDADIEGNSIIYTNGGVVEDVNPPAYNITTLFDTRQWIVTSEDPNLMWFSKQVIEGTPVEFSDLFTFYVPPTTAAEGSTGPITAIAPMDDKLIVFKQNALYYINGTGPDNTGANNAYSPVTFVTATVGCTNQQSIVFTPAGLMFQSNKGIWLLGRDLNTTYIGAPVEDLTTGNSVLSAIGVPGTNQVRFTMSSGVTLMYDYYFQQWGTFSGIPAISACIYQGLQTYLNKFGAVYQETPGLYLDGTNPVLMSFLTGWLNLAGLQGFQRAYMFFLLGQYISPHFLTISIAYDYNPSPTQGNIIQPTNYSPNYGLQPGPYGSGPQYGGPGNVEQWKVHMDQQKCEAFQIGLQESYDPSKGIPSGAGFTLSGIDLVVGKKLGYPKLAASQQIG
jgi:hypothetical protein